MNTTIETLRTEVKKSFPDSMPPSVRFEKGNEGELRVTRENQQWTIRGGDTASCARGLGFVLAGREVSEKTPFQKMGVMLDCSRNRVPSISALKKHFLRLALMGYNWVLLYCEDTYVLPNEPRFGYMRGAYTLAEIKELDAYASGLGMEITACIQTLGHCEQFLRWSAYGNVRDTGNILLVDEPKTYELIKKMIAFWREGLHSERIHIGMDEAHALGRGKFMDLHGPQSPFDIINRHLKKVSGICHEAGLKPIIWSDMYFRIGSATHDYYDTQSVIPEKIKQEIPDDVTLCYWDYYHKETAFYEDFIKRHRELNGEEPVMGSGIWSWCQFWYDHEWTRATLVPCVEACRKSGLKEIFFTMWGDSGAYCLPESILAGEEFAAGTAYGENPDDPDSFAAHMKAVCGKDYNLFLEISRRRGKHYWSEWPDLILEENLLWDDPLYGMACNAYRARNNDAVDDFLGQLDSLSARLELEKTAGVSELETIAALVRVLRIKLRFQDVFFDAYEHRDLAKLTKIHTETIPDFRAALKDFDEKFAANWRKNSKPFGLEVIQRRNAGVMARLDVADNRLALLLSGEISAIEELDAALAGRGSFDESFAQFVSGSSSL